MRPMIRTLAVFFVVLLATQACGLASPESNRVLDLRTRPTADEVRIPGRDSGPMVFEGELIFPEGLRINDDPISAVVFEGEVIEVSYLYHQVPLDEAVAYATEIAELYDMDLEPIDDWEAATRRGQTTQDLTRRYITAADRYVGNGGPDSIALNFVIFDRNDGGVLLQAYWDINPLPPVATTTTTEN